MNEANVRKYLEVLKRAISLIEGELSGNPVTSGMSQPALSPAIANPDYQAARAKHIQDLMAIDCWPEAVPEHLLSNAETDEQHINRANAVLDYLIDVSIENKHFLDYGCGAGWVAKEAILRGVASSTGFDIEENKTWDADKARFTTKPQDLLPNHYDAIFLYDVVDHCQEPQQMMNHIKTLLSPGGKVYVRCHPWCAKHASHLYKLGLNKAFIHLFLKEHEIQGLGYNQLFTQRLTDPLSTYKQWFSGFNIEKERVISSPISDFFHVPSFKQLVIDEQKLTGSRQEAFFKDMELEFVDYRLIL